MGITLIRGYYFGEKIEKSRDLTNRNSKLGRERKSGWMNLTKVKEKTVDERQLESYPQKNKKF